MEIEVSIGGNAHSITSNNVLCCAETGRVLAVFYNDYDLVAIGSSMQAMQSALSEATARVERAEAELVELNAKYIALESRFTGPDGFATWQDAAIAERVKRVAAESELKAAREQEPIATVYIGSGHCKVAFTDAVKEAMKGRQGKSFDVYAGPMPRAVKDSLIVGDSAAQVPQEWREVIAELAADLQAACDAEHPHREQYPSIMRKHQNDMAIVERARAMPQEVKS